MKVRVYRQHNIDVVTIRHRIDAVAARDIEKFGHLASSIEGGWHDNTLTMELSAYGLDGVIETQVEIDSVTVVANFPVALALFKNKIKHMIEFRIDRML